MTDGQVRRLSTLTLAAERGAIGGAPATTGAVRGPMVDPGALSIGIVHFGIGAFHRAHQAVFTEDAAVASVDTRWGILGVTGRSDAVVRRLRPQDCLYGVLERGPETASLRLVGSVRDAAWPGRDSERVTEQLAGPATHLATLTITEKGYLRGADGELDFGLEQVRRDVAAIAAELAGDGDGSASLTPLGLLVRGLARRFRRGGKPFTVVACDNLVDNGSTTRRVVRSYAEAGGGVGEFTAWLEDSVTFPSTMVDRLTPATTDDDRVVAEGILGLRDEALVVAEPFKQWVIEDDFAGPRPDWERAGAVLTSDVAPYERVKLRVLNGTHSMLASLGALKGHRTIAEAVTDPPLRDAVLRVLNDDILPSLRAPAGVDLVEYRDSVLQRFANPMLGHTTRQVNMDGSQKVSVRFLSAAADRLDAGHLPLGLAFALAAWISYIASTSDAAGPLLDDPLAAPLHAAVGSSAALAATPESTVERVFAIEEIFTPAVRASSAFRAAVVAALPKVRALTAPDSR